MSLGPKMIGNGIFLAFYGFSSKQEKNDGFLPTACLHLKKWATPVHLWYTRTNFELPLGQATHYLLKFRSSIIPGLVGAQDGPLDVPDPGVVGGV